MARIKNISGVDRTVPALGGRLVVADQIVEVPDEETFGFTCQEANWQPTDEAAKKAHAKGVRAEKKAVEPEPSAPADESDQKEN